MERSVPMDRLICGDVGYGKTEIAVRAAFKAVQDGKQVAVLVPTTLLVQQHLQTFTERYAQFPVVVKALSRFQTDAEAKEVIAGLKDGSVDLVIGTHRLLSGEIAFKDLGLVVVDEEQRFGVEHKEQLKRLRTAVDVLAMSATPIPRTLEMAVTGIREMSTLATPPEERHPVLTFVGAYDEKQITAAIRRELLREGQVFLVHNKVTSIERAAARIRELVPEARVATAHGQMGEHRLEQVVLDFWDKKFDVLICTTIIETGLDISNANTLIIERSDSLGLSQLHQLRGRVGRGRERAYCYFLYPPEKPLTETAHDRLATMASHTDLGAGMQIAMKDLEIRGAGNLLGGEQSGHIAGVGFDLYVRLVGEAVADFRGEGDKAPVEVKIELPVDAHLPHDYVPGERLRLEAYRKLATVEDEAGLAEIEAELQDRYGTPPEPVRNLLAVARLRTHARKAELADISVQGNFIRFGPLELPESAAAAAAAALPRQPGQGRGPYHSRAQADDGAGRWPAAARHGGADLGQRPDPRGPARPDGRRGARRRTRKGTAVKALRTARPSVRTAAPAALVLGAAVLLSGCGAQQPGAAAVVNGRVITDADAQQVAAADQHGARGAAEAHPGRHPRLADPRAVRHRPGREGRQGDLRGPGPRRGQGDREPLAGDAGVRAHQPGRQRPERAGPHRRPVRGQQGQDQRQPPLRHARPQAADAQAAGPELDEAGTGVGHRHPGGPGARGAAAVVAARLSLLLSTPRIAPGLLSREAWATLERAGEVLGRDADEPQLLAIEDAGVPATALGDVHPAELARLLVDRATEADVVWVGSSDGDPGLTDALAAEVSRRDDPPEVEMLVGSYDVPGSRLLDLVAVMDRLRSPGGCPWDAQQTHESLVPYLIEESHEAVEAIESGDRGAHDRGARRRAAAGGLPRAGRPGGPAGAVRHRRRRRAGSSRSSSGATRTSSPTSTPTRPPRWPRTGSTSRPPRSRAARRVLDGIPAGLPALARADKAASRLERAGLSALARARPRTAPTSARG